MASPARWKFTHVEHGTDKQLILEPPCTTHLQERFVPMVNTVQLVVHPEVQWFYTEKPANRSGLKA